MDLKALERSARNGGSQSTRSSTAAGRSVPSPNPAYRRAYQRLNQLRRLGLFQPEPVDGYPGEIPDHDQPRICAG